MSARAPILAAAALALAAACTRPTRPFEGYDAGQQKAACSPTCGEGTVCVEGACVERTCETVQCVAGATCVKGQCYSQHCGLSQCPAGTVCDESRCVEAACAGVTCPYGQCVDGGCPQCSSLEYFEPDAGRCAVRHPVGATCGVSDACASGFCVAGVCCSTPCDGPCEACGANGQCAFRPVLAPGAPQCFPGRCSGVSRECQTGCTSDAECAAGAHCRGGVCTANLALGGPCTYGAQCQSGICTEGACCDRACADDCATCLGTDAGPAGACKPSPAGTDPRCASLSTCSGTSETCPQSRCAGDTWCVRGTYCGDAGTCRPNLGLGQSCDRAAMCQSGLCRDGRCCEAGCTGPCRACAGNGTCAALPDGTADAGCPGSQQCEQGECCQTACQALCMRCDNPGSLGLCAPAGRRSTCVTGYSCAPDAGACLTSCSIDADCAAGRVCYQSQCRVPCDGACGAACCKLSTWSCTPPPCAVE